MDSQVRSLIPLFLAVLPSPLHAQTLDLTRIEAVADSVAGAHIAAGSMPAMTVAVARNAHDRLCPRLRKGERGDRHRCRG
jgi:hypothetical protein